MRKQLSVLGMERRGVAAGKEAGLRGWTLPLWGLFTMGQCRDILVSNSLLAWRVCSLRSLPWLEKTLKSVEASTKALQ